MPTALDLPITSHQAQSANRPVRRPHSRIIRVEKIQRAFRILGRIYNPLNDATAGALFTSSFICPISGECSSSLVPISMSSLALMLSSVAYEVYSSLKLSNETPFVYGQSDTRQLIILQDKLSAIIGSQVSQLSLPQLLNLPNLPDDSCNDELICLVQDFQRVRQYNHVRKLTEVLNVALLSEVTLNYLILVAFFFLRDECCFNDEKLFDFPEVAFAFPAIAAFFIFKGLIHHIEYQWEHYEGAWKKLPLPLRKALVGLREVIDSCYDLIFALIRVGLGVGGAMTPLLSEECEMYNDCNPKRVWDFRMRYMFAGMLFGAFYASPAIVSYVITQRIPSHKPVCDKGIIHSIKRFNQALIAGTGIGGALLFPLAIAYFLVISGSESWDVTSGTLLTLFTLIAALGGITTAVNTWVNYQERDSKKLTVVDDEVHTLRQALLAEERASVLPRAYGSIELGTPGSNSPTPAPVVKEPKTQVCDTCSWFPFWRSSNRKNKTAAQILPLQETLRDQPATTNTLIRTPL
jgi:hypothetical protein